MSRNEFLVRGLQQLLNERDIKKSANSSLRKAAQHALGTPSPPIPYEVKATPYTPYLPSR